MTKGGSFRTPTPIMSDPSFAHVPKAVLCGSPPLPSFLAMPAHARGAPDHFTPGSVWSAVPNLVAIEKGFTEVQLEKRLVNLRTWSACERGSG